MANEEHLKIIQQGVAAWNEWREKNAELHPDLSDAVLREANLREANLNGADRNEVLISPHIFLDEAIAIKEAILKAWKFIGDREARLTPILPAARSGLDLIYPWRELSSHPVQLRNATWVPRRRKQ